MNDNQVVRPKVLTDNMLIYLDDLRASGKTNMLGAGAYLERAFLLTKGESTEVLTYWMKTFGQEKR